MTDTERLAVKVGFLAGLVAGRCVVFAHDRSAIEQRRTEMLDAYPELADITDLAFDTALETTRG